jgi:hypothetical protein
MSGLIWLSLAFCGLAYEMIALASRTDAHQPLTYYVRRIIRRPVAWVAALAFWGWVAWHFFVST